ncbi:MULTISPECIES: PAS domain S-box protein [unclassified Microcoleus]|uniref:PAS domain S-box protein n=1 Tax=unclassified Microcoleus TaxID=2642155 RepID=UPI001DE4E2D4|nr:MULTISPECIES: PAS domain S-box protein [unclassified Microcoleus]MCC3502143.1 PAS domain S-box protein [Microcoleus sp. PH2017_19_SFW_U_A]MCC3521963.1 PAS domain S-box protein [Microcoleus sp. PH2017_20_SFW_D_A]MCC3553513.1 PAS domain S-box protein [Microcoleus sp. PH2017_35_SFW_U_B]TAG87942.1 MAG: PAS domain S-box protein [Oscillatoriales cyanobacterium]
MSEFLDGDREINPPSAADDRTLICFRERKLRTIWETALDAIAIADNKGRYLNVNPAACELLGLKREQLLGRWIWEFAKPSWNFQQVWEECQKPEKVQGEFELVRADTEIRTVEYAITLNFWPHRYLLVMRDVTGRKQAETQVEELTRQLAQTQAQLREAGIAPESPISPTDTGILEQIARHIPGVIYQFRMDIDGGFHFPYASGRLEEIYGVTREQVQQDATCIFNHLHPEDFDRVYQSILDSAQHQTPWCCEYRLCFPDGRLRWLRGDSTPQRQPDGSTIWHGYVRDNTESKAAEIAIKTSENRFRTIVENLNDMVYIVNPDSTFSYVSPQLKEIMGYEAAEMLHESFANWVYPEDLPICKNTLDRSLQGEKLRGSEYRVLHRDGNYYWHSANVSAIVNDAGEFVACLGIARYIHPQKQAQIALEESNSRWQLAIEGAGDGTWDWNLKTNEVIFSRQWKAMLGYAEHEIVNDLAEWDGRVHPEDKAQCYIDFAKHFRGETSTCRNEHRLRCKDGSYKWILDRGQVVEWDEESEPMRFIGTHCDISDRKTAELELAASQAELIALFNAMQDVIMVLDAEGRYLKISPSSAPLLYKPTAQILGKTLHEVLPKESADFFLESIQEAIANQCVTQLEYSLPIGDRSVWFDARISPMSQEQVVFVARDITDRKRQQQALRLVVEGTAAKTGAAFFKSCVQYLAKALEVRYALIAEFGDSEKTIATTLAFWAGDEFGDNFTYHLSETPCQNVERCTKICRYPNLLHCWFPKDDNLASLQAQSYAGVPIVDAAGNCWGLLVVMDTEPMVKYLEMQSAILRIFATRAAAEMERMQAEAAVRQSEIQLRLQTEELEATLKKLQDTQTQLIQAEKMSSLGQLVAGIAHEINNPVSFIYGNIQPATDCASELIQLIHLYREHYPIPPQAIADFIEDIELEYLENDFYKLLKSMKTGAARISDIVKSLRTFSRLDEADLKSTDIHENLESTLVILQNRLNGRAGKPEIHVAKYYGEVPLVECYGGLLNQVFMNLLVNAIDAIEQRRESLEPSAKLNYIGRIAIATSFAADNRVSISIHDNGCGITPEVQEKIFNPFFTTKPVGKGTGMGLATSYQIVTENHRGKLRCFSTPGEGAELAIELPTCK